MDLFTEISVLQLFGLGILVSIFQVRHILLLFVGVTEIMLAELTILQTLLAASGLIILINASQLIIIVVALTLSGRSDALFSSVNSWLTKNNRQVAVFVSLIGIFLLWDGLSNLGIFG